MSVYIRGFIVAGLLSLGLLGAWYILGGRLQSEPEKSSLGALDRLERDGVPPFTLPDMDGNPFSIQNLKGRVVILNFWATWCAPCVEEFPSMIAMAEKFGGKVVLVTIAADERKEDILTFTKALKLNSRHWVNLWDPGQTLAKDFGTSRLPETYILKRDLKVIKKVVNSLDWNSQPVTRYLEELIAK